MTFTGVVDMEFATQRQKRICFLTRRWLLH